MDTSKKLYKVFKGTESEARYMRLTPAEVATYRHRGYYVTEA